jgi:hypothetical protein
LDALAKDYRFFGEISFGQRALDARSRDVMLFVAGRDFRNLLRTGQKRQPDMTIGHSNSDKQDNQFGQRDERTWTIGPESKDIWTRQSGHRRADIEGKDKRAFGQ